jgi:hypothetical protein
MRWNVTEMQHLAAAFLTDTKSIIRNTSCRLWQHQALNQSMMLREVHLQLELPQQLIRASEEFRSMILKAFNIQYCGRQTCNWVIFFDPVTRLTSEPVTRFHVWSYWWNKIEILNVIKKAIVLLWSCYYSLPVLVTVDCWLAIVNRVQRKTQHKYRTEKC